MAVWHLVTGMHVRTLQHRSQASGTAISVAWSPEGSLIAAGSEAGTVTVWDVCTGVVKVALQGLEASMVPVGWSPDGRQLCTGDSRGSCKLWDAGTGDLLHDHTDGLPCPSSRPFSLVPCSVSWSPDRCTVATGTASHSVRVLDVFTGALLHVLPICAHIHIADSGACPRTGEVTCVSWSHDGSMLAYGSDDKTTTVWDAVSATAMHTLHGHTGEVLSVAWHPDGRLLATGGGDGTVRVWVVASGTAAAVHKVGKSAQVCSVAWSQCGQAVLLVHKNRKCDVVTIFKVTEGCQGSG